MNGGMRKSNVTCFGLFSHLLFRNNTAMGNILKEGGSRWISKEHYSELRFLILLHLQLALGAQVLPQSQKEMILFKYNASIIHFELNIKKPVHHSQIQITQAIMKM